VISGEGVAGPPRSCSGWARAELNIPIYLEQEVLGYLMERAEAKGVEVGELVNDLLKRDIALTEALK
jgi:hypothetical protein